jgi:hypothetical protein
MYFIINVLCAFPWHLYTNEFAAAGTNFHKQNSAFLGYYEYGVCYAFPELVFCIYFNFLRKSSYSLGEYATLDEMLLAFRGRCGFKIYRVGHRIRTREKSRLLIK